jgi:opacity protein-like surface antigen
MVNGHYVSLPIKDYDNIDDVKLKNNNYYISLPIMVKYFVNEFISIDLGPQISYLTFAQISNGSKEWTDVKDSYNTLDYGVNLGASYEMDNGMNINIRYNYNFANVYKSDYFDLKANNTNIQVSLGYKFY